MKVVFRCDAALHIGTGHVMRCLTLAATLKEKGTHCLFICRQQRGHLIHYIEQQGFTALSLPASDSPPAMVEQSSSDAPDYSSWLGCDWRVDAQQTISNIAAAAPDWLVVDHYALDSRWETQLRRHCHRILAIDDLANRHHNCDLLLDQNFGRHGADYQPYVSENCTILTGSNYSLLRPEFHQWREYSLHRRANNGLATLLITMGGVDKDNATGKVLETLKKCTLPPNCKIQVVMGSTAPWLTAVQSIAVKMPWPTEVVVEINTMAQCMANADLAIGAAGSTSWERCCIGLPTIMLTLADNQRPTAQALHEAQAAWLLGDLHELERYLPMALSNLGKASALLQMSKHASNITDGTGCARVTAAMGEFHD